MNDTLAAIVAHGDGPAAVIAAAGSGKTRAAVERAARLIKDGHPTLLLTFSAAAADSMRSRLFQLTGGSDGVRVYTYHALALFLIRRFGRSAGIDGDLDLLTPNEEGRLLRRTFAQVLEESGDEDPAGVGRILTLFQRLRAEGRMAAFPEHAAKLTGWPRPAFEIALEVLEETKREQRQAAFEDLILWAPKVLSGKAARKWREAHAAYLIIDEYQDTSAIQARFLEALAPGDTPNLMVIGDPNQAIYGWRGAGRNTFSAFLERYPEARVYALRANHRSRPPILKAAEAVIAPLYQPGQEAFYRLLPVRTGGRRPVARFFASAFEEARWVARQIEGALAAGAAPSSLAVLSRTGQGLYLIEGELFSRGVPVRTLGGMRLSERLEVKTLLRLLKGAVLEHDPSLATFLEDAVPGVGSATVATLLEAAAAARLPLAQWLLEANPGEVRLTKRAREGLALMRSLIFATRTLFDETPFAEALEEVARLLYRDVLADLLRRQARRGPSEQDRWGNLERLFALARAFSTEGSADLKGFLDHLLTSEAGQGDEVSLSTVHAAKGLEWETVFVVGLVEGHFPVLGEDADLEEERRLFYVALTRARDRLYLTAPRFAAHGRALAPSRFLTALIRDGLVEELRPAQAA